MLKKKKNINFCFITFIDFSFEAARIHLFFSITLSIVIADSEFFIISIQFLKIYKNNIFQKKIKNYEDAMMGIKFFKNYKSVFEY